MSKIAFTICANNYLANAKVLIDSFCNTHPTIKFKIILLDKYDETIRYTYFSNENIVLASDILNLDLDNFALTYSISELSTLIKPFVFQYLFKQFSEIIYLDPDIQVFKPLDLVWDALTNNKFNFVLTPHILTPIDDDYIPSDFHTLRTGIFNLGFIGLSSSEMTLKFLVWWGDRLLKYGFNNLESGMFYDQIWANYIPVFFKNYLIIYHTGYNVANWNWHERFITKEGEIWKVNSDEDLVFFHFSNFKINRPDILCGYNTRFTKENREDLVPLFQDYINLLNSAKIETLDRKHVYYNNIFQKRKAQNEKWRSYLYNRIIFYLIRKLKQFVIKSKKV